jgi:hypothetical protein
VEQGHKDGEQTVTGKKVRLGHARERTHKKSRLGFQLSLCHQPNYYTGRYKMKQVCRQNGGGGVEVFIVQKERWSKKGKRFFLLAPKWDRKRSFWADAALYHTL